MQAYKLKGKIDQSGNLLITEPLNLPPRKGEIVVWAATDTLDHTTTAILILKTKEDKVLYVNKRTSV